MRSERVNNPLQFPAPGSAFKKPETGVAAGWCLDEGRIKGYQEGGARVSKKHTNWILNVDNASSQDITRVDKHMKSEVHNEFGIQLKKVKIYP